MDTRQKSQNEGVGFEYVFFFFTSSQEQANGLKY